MVITQIENDCYHTTSTIRLRPQQQSLQWTIIIMKNLMMPLLMIMLHWCSNHVIADTPSCVPYDSNIGTTYGGVIADGTLIYIDGSINHNLTQIESSASIGALALAGFTNTTCKRTWGTLMAASYYLLCDVNQWTTNGLAYPRLPCQGLCTRTVAACRGVDLALMTILYFGTLTCTSSNKILPGLGLPDYPAISTTFSDNTVTQCNAAPSLLANYGRCEAYTGTVCDGVLPAGAYHYIPAGRCQGSLESILSPLPTLLAALQPSCATATAVLLCNSVFLRCDNTSISQQITTFTFGAAGVLPPIPVPRFVHRSTCDTWANACPSVADQQFLATFGANGDLGYSPNLADDYTKLSVLLGSSLPVCNSIGVNAPGDNYDYPVNATIFAKVAVPVFGQLVLSTPPFTPISTGITYNVAQCVPFNNAAIIAGVPLYQPDGSLRTDTPTSYCQGIVNEGDLIYVPAGNTLSTLNDQIRQIHWLFGVMPTTNDCVKAFMRYACFQAFNPCDGTQLSLTFDVAPNIGSGDYTTHESRRINITSAFPRFPCSDVCYDFASRCADFIASTPELTPNCTKRTLAPNGNTAAEIKSTSCDGTVTGQSQRDFPTSTTWFTAVTWPPKNITAGASYGISVNSSVTINGITLPILPLSVTIQTQCGHNETTVINMANVQLFCLHPTISPYETGATSYEPGGSMGYGNNFYINDGSCAVKCPPPIYSNSRIQAVWGFYRAFVVISWICLLILMVTYIKFRERRERQLLFCFLFSCFLACTSGLFSVFKAPEHQICHSEGQDVQQDGRPSATCSAQGAMFQITVLACVLWWACQGVDIFLQLMMTRRWLIANKKKLHIAYHFVAWTLPILTGILGLTDRTYGQVGALAFCTWSNVSTGYVWGVFYAPVLLSLIVGAVCMLTVIFTIVRSAKATLQDGKAQFRLVIRPLAFITIFFFIFIIVFAQTIYQEQNRTNIFDNVFSWVACRLVTIPKSYYYDPYHNTTEPASAYGNCGDLPSRPPAFGLFVALHLAISTQGILMFLNYGTEYRNWQLWRDWYRSKRNKSRGDGSHGQRSGGSKGTAQTSRGHASTNATNNGPTRQGSVGPATRHNSTEQQDLMKGVRGDATEPFLNSGAVPSSPNGIELDSISEDSAAKAKRTRKQSTAAEMFAAELEAEAQLAALSGTNRSSVVTNTSTAAATTATTGRASVSTGESKSSSGGGRVSVSIASTPASVTATAVAPATATVSSVSGDDRDVSSVDHHSVISSSSSLALESIDSSVVPPTPVPTTATAATPPDNIVVV